MRKVKELNKIGDSVVISLRDEKKIDLEELLYIVGYIKEHSREALAERKASKRTYKLEVAQEKQKNILCIECGILYHADIEDMPEGGCPKCGDDTPLVNQLPLSWIRDVMVTLVDAISKEQVIETKS